MFFQNHSYQLYEELYKIYEKKEGYTAYNYKKDEKGIFKLLIKMGLSDVAISKLFGTNQTKINRLKREYYKLNNSTKLISIRIYDKTNSHLFHWKVKDVGIKELKQLENLIKESDFKLTRGINILKD